MPLAGERLATSKSGSGKEVQRAAQSQTEQVVLFRVGKALCCADISDVGGLIRVPEFTTVPCAPPAVLGIFNHRGHVLTAISLRGCFGLPEAEAGVGYVLLARLQDGLTGFGVDDFTEIVSPAEDWWHPLPATVSVAFCDRVLLREDGIFMLMKLDRLFELLHIHKSPEVIARMAHQIRASEAMTSGVDQSVGRATHAGRPVFAAATGEELDPVEALGGLGAASEADFGKVVSAGAEPPPSAAPTEAEQPADEEEQALDEAVAQEAAAQDPGDTSTPMAETAESEGEIAREAEPREAFAPVDTDEEEPESVPSGPIADSEEEAAANAEALAAPALAEPDQPAAEAEQAGEEAVSREDVAHDAEGPSVPPAPAESEDEAAGATEPVETSAPVDAGEQARESVSASETTDPEEKGESESEPEAAPVPVEADEKEQVPKSVPSASAVDSLAEGEFVGPTSAEPQREEGEATPSEVPVRVDFVYRPAWRRQPSQTEEPIFEDEAPARAIPTNPSGSPEPRGLIEAHLDSGEHTEWGRGAAIPTSQSAQAGTPLAARYRLRGAREDFRADPQLRLPSRAEEWVRQTSSPAVKWVRETVTWVRSPRLPGWTVLPASRIGGAVLVGGALLALLLLAFAVWSPTPVKTPTDRASGQQPPPASVDRRLTQSPSSPPVSEERGTTQAPPFRVPEIERKVTVHVVVWGDTLSKISRRYLSDMMRYPELARDNEIKNPDLIYPGDIVRIQPERQPPANPN